MEVQVMEALVTKLMEKRSEKQKLKDEQDLIQKDINILESELIETLEELDLEDYRGKAGTVSRKQKWSVRVPKDGIAKKELFDYLKKEDLFDAYATVNSISLNSLFLEKWEEAKQEGKGGDFTLPGIEQPTAFTKLNVRKRT